MSRIQHRLDGQPEMMPSALRAEICQAIIEEKVSRADFERWTPDASKRALSAFIETGAVLNDQILVQVEFAWRLYKQGRLQPLGASAERSPAVQAFADRNRARFEGVRTRKVERATRRFGGMGQYRHISDPADPLFDLDKERRLAAKKLAGMSRDEYYELGVSERNVQHIRHGRLPKFTIPTIMKLLEPKRPRNHGAEPQQTGANPAHHDGEARVVEGSELPRQ